MTLNEEIERGLKIFPDLCAVTGGKAMPIIVARLVKRIELLEERIRSLESSRK